MVCWIRGRRWSKEGVTMEETPLSHEEFPWNSSAFTPNKDWQGRWLSGIKGSPHPSISPSVIPFPFSPLVPSSGDKWIFWAGFRFPGLSHPPATVHGHGLLPYRFPRGNEMCWKPRNPISISFYPFILFDSRFKDCETLLHCLASEQIYILLHRSYFFPSVFMTMDSESERMRREINMYTWVKEITLLTKAASMSQLKTGPCSYAAHR